MKVKVINHKPIDPHTSQIQDVVYDIVMLTRSGVNFSTFYVSVFRTKVIFRQLFYVCMYVKKLPKRHLYEKFVRIMLMKLTPELKPVFFNLGSAEPRGSAQFSLGSVRVFKLALF